MLNWSFSYFVNQETFSLSLDQKQENKNINKIKIVYFLIKS
jgi:hypothetical protein